MAPRPEHPEAAPTPVRTPVDMDCDEVRKKCPGDVASTNLDDVECGVGRSEELPLKPCSDGKLARSVSNRTARPQRFYRAPPPDGGWGWMVLLGVVIGNILIIGHAKTFGVYITTLVERFDEKLSRVAWIQSIQFSFFLGFAPIASMLTERFSPRAVTLVGAFIACLGMALSAMAKSITHLYFSYGVMMGLAAVFTFTPGVIMIAKYFDRRRGLANGLGMAGNSLGGIFMPILADFLISEYSLHGGFLIMGGILLNAAVGAMLWRPVKAANTRPRALSSASKALLPIPSLSARTPTANEQMVTPLLSDVTVARNESDATAVLPEEVPSEVLRPLNSLTALDNTENLLSSSVTAVSSMVDPPPLPSTCSTSVPDMSVPSVTSTDKNLPANFEVQSQPSTSPPPMEVSSGSQRKKRLKEDRSLETQQSLDHQSIFSQSTASLSSFVYLSTFHLGPSFGTVDDITNLRYDDDDDDGEGVDDVADDQEEELNNLDDSDEEDDDYDVYETVRARSDLKVDIAGLLAAGSVANENPTDPSPAVKELEVVLKPKKAITPEPSADVNNKEAIGIDGSVSRTRTSSKQRKPAAVAEKNTKPPAGSGRKRPPVAKPLKPLPRKANKYFDFSFFRSHVFYVMMVPLFLHSIGYPTIQMYTPMYARSLGFSTSDSARCLSFLAFADVLGRIGCAWLSDLQLCKRKYFYMTGMLFSGMVAYCMPFAKTYLQLLLCTSGFGLASGAYIGLTVALFADAYGNDKVAKAHSMATMCTGIAGLAGGPFIGYVFETTKSFVVCYTILGSCQILGGFVYLLEPWAAQTDAKKLRAQQWV